MDENDKIIDAGMVADFAMEGLWQYDIYLDQFSSLEAFVKDFEGYIQKTYTPKMNIDFQSKSWGCVLGAAFKHFYPAAWDYTEGTPLLVMQNQMKLDPIAKMYKYLGEPKENSLVDFVTTMAALGGYAAK